MLGAIFEIMYKNEKICQILQKSCGFVVYSCIFEMYVPCMIEKVLEYMYFEVISIIIPPIFTI